MNVATAADSIFTKFNAFLLDVERTRSRMESLYSAGQVSRRDIETSYEGLFLSVITRFEVLIEDLFFGLLAGRIDGGSCRSAPRIQVSSNRVAREIVFRERSYIDWLPYARTEELARAFLSRGRPFTALEPAEKGTLTSMLAIRHAIAHRSRHANAAFKLKVLGAIPLPPRERTPAGFLRSQYRTNPPETRLQLYVNQIRKVSFKITHK